MSVSKLMRLETYDDSSFFFQAGVVSILSLVVGLPGSLTGGVNEVKGGSLTEFNGADLERP